MQPHLLGIKGEEPKKKLLLYKNASSITRTCKGNREAELEKTMQSSSNQKLASRWDSTSDDYLAHLIRMERALSITPGVPHYPDVHRAFHNKSPYEEEQANLNKQRQTRQVSFQDQQGNGDNGQEQRRQGFELCKWKTFKGYGGY